MIEVKKPFMTGQLDYTILTPFNIEDKIGEFKKSLKSFIKDNKDKNITEFKMGCKKEIAQEYAKSKKSEYIEISMSLQLLEFSKIKDVTEKNIFIASERIYGWLIFIDKDIFANWGHECQYIFFVNNEISFEKQMLFPPNENFSMEVV